MTISRRRFTAVAATLFLPFPRSQRGPTCIYETTKTYDDLPHGWLLLGADAGPMPKFTEIDFNWRCIRQIDLENANGRPIAIIWLQNSVEFPDPERAFVGDLPSFLAGIAEYRRKAGMA